MSILKRHPQHEIRFWPALSPVERTPLELAEPKTKAAVVELFVEVATAEFQDSAVLDLCKNVVIEILYRARASISPAVSARL